ncbi:MFS transporter [Burkholderia vietnamiensis]|uniref:MFS transporter n=1 Tax=Burkholderia vietnamiensis TaxID=60552 RepID=UPI0015931DB7|nr:MFS transporter [Burkholderia vietnamiensis]
MNSELDESRPALPEYPGSTRAPTIAYVTLFAASLGFAIVQLDVTIVNIALPGLRFGSRSSVSFLQWIVDAYTLPFSCLLLSAGALGARFGVRRTYRIGLLLFALASFACAQSQAPAALIIARCTQGAAASLIVPSSLVLVNDTFRYTPRARAFAIAIWSATGGVAIAAGPMIGSLVIQYGGWRGIFLINLPLCVLGLVCTACVAEAVRAPSRRLHLTGQACATLCMALLIAAIIESGVRPMTDPIVLAALSASIAFGLLFATLERRVDEPLLPKGMLNLHFFRYPTLIGMVMNATYFGILFVLTLFLQGTLRYTVTQTALAFLPLTATFVVSNIASGWLMGIVSARVTMALGASTAACGFLLLAAMTENPANGLFIPFILIPGGIGLAIPAITSAVMESVDEAFVGVASAALNAARQVAGAIGVAAFGALLSSGSDSAGPALRTACMGAAALQFAGIALALAGLSSRAKPA